MIAWMNVSFTMASESLIIGDSVDGVKMRIDFIGLAEEVKKALESRVSYRAVRVFRRLAKAVRKSTPGYGATGQSPSKLSHNEDNQT